MDGEKVKWSKEEWMIGHFYMSKAFLRSIFNIIALSALVSGIYLEYLLMNVKIVIIESGRRTSVKLRDG